MAVLSWRIETNQQSQHITTKGFINLQFLQKLSCQKPSVNKRFEDNAANYRQNIADNHCHSDRIRRPTTATIMLLIIGRIMLVATFKSLLVNTARIMLLTTDNDTFYCQGNAAYHCQDNSDRIMVPITAIIMLITKSR